MLQDFNLLATAYRGNEKDAQYELEYLLKQIGDASPVTGRTGISGLIAAKTSSNPIEAVQKLREILLERPYEFRYMLRVIPIEKVIRTNLEEIKNMALEFANKIGESETFRITVEKRFTTMHMREIVEAAASNVKRKVELVKPDKILLIEVVGKFTGMSVIKPDGLLLVMREKAL